MNTQQLLNQIETLRKSLNEYSDRENFNDPEILALSRRLDELLNLYYKIIQKNTK